MPAWAGSPRIPAIPSAHGRVTLLGALRLQMQMQIHTACGTEGRLRLDCIASHRIALPHPPMTTCFTGTCNDFKLLVGGGKALPPSSLPPFSFLPSATRVRFPTSSTFASLHARRRPRRYIGAGYTGGRTRSSAIVRCLLQVGVGGALAWNAEPGRLRLRSRASACSIM
ncbi:hypothetical protein DFH08DRAFT_100775 [Mycena albidolilacea]|uniref:Uncharacterized protein n=1 Tax=Mycena albidolilacea TaxID=1033008 RepID=A0AAD7EVL1_9AGAR|nr:hypothetical protein DFH08DRAFT_100775 [Mycena albidolilacea]